MTAQDALDALRNGDYKTASTLLEALVKQNGYASDTLNHAYTVALHQAGDQDAVFEASADIARRLVRKNPSLALDYFQRAAFFGEDPVLVREACEIQERLAVPAPKGPERIRTDRVAHVIGCFLPGHAPSLYIQLLSKSLAELGVQSHVFTTEWAASWFFNPTGQQQSQPYKINAEVTVGSVDGDFFSRAERVASAIRKEDIDIALYHCGPTEQITVRVAGLHPTPIQVNVNHATEVDADLFDGFAHLFQNGLERARFEHRLSRWIPLISDIEDRLAAATPKSRKDLDIEAATTVSGTFGNLFKTSPDYLDAVSAILRRFPNHYHVVAGSGDAEPLRSAFEAAGVLSRVRLLGYFDEVAPFLDTIDLYLNTFPISGGQSVLEPMAAGKPVVIRRYPTTSHFNAGAELSGIPAMIADSDEDYVQTAARLIESPDLRAKYGKQLQQRFQAEFRPEDLGRKYLDFFQELIRKTE